MYTRGVLVKFKSLRPLAEVRIARIPDFPCSFSVAGFVRNLSTASERLDIYNNFEGKIAENNVDRSSYNQNDRFYGRNLGGLEQNQNPRGVYGQSANGHDGGFGTKRSDVSNTYSSGNQESRFLGRKLDGGGEQIQNPSRLYGQNFDVQQNNFASRNVDNAPLNVVQQYPNFNGYGNSGGTQQQNPRVYFDGQNNVEGPYGGNRNMPRQSVENGGMYPHTVSGVNYSSSENYQQSWSGTRSDGMADSRLTSYVKSSSESVEVAQGSQFRSKVEDLDELIKEGKLKEAVELLELLHNEGLLVDLPRYVALMQACGESEALDEAKSVHEHLLKSMPHPEVKVYNLILEMYSRCGSMKDAFAVFDQMPQRNLTSWDIMIYWLAKNGLAEDSIDLFTEFKRSGLKPDGQMFLGVFSACGFLCDIFEGMLHFESMMKDYGIAPTMEHYVSIVEMFGNAGFLDEALEFIEKMPVEPDIDIWESLMKFSRLHGNVELGDRCAELVELLDPSRLNEQSRAGLIPINAADLAREKEKKKLSGQNLLDVRSRVHEYRAGDRSHPEHEKIYTLLRGLKQQMKEVGYIPETKFVLHDVDQEVKEEALMAHSERLAAAQGFLTSAARSPLRIIKNLRVCGDCHNAFKIISKIVGREIIARDSKRFHHFRDGSCSCNDYW